MAELTYRDAVIRGIAQEMARDPRSRRRDVNPRNAIRLKIL